MQIEIKNKDSINIPLLGHIIFGTDDDCDVVLETASDSTPKQRVCSVIHDKSTCMLEVFSDFDVSINNNSVKEMAILHPGDTFSVGNETFKIIDENKLPKICNTNFKLNKDTTASEQLITSVSGLRSYNKSNNGELFIIGTENSFSYNPVSKQDTPFGVSYLNDKLTILCQKGKYIQINGNKANHALLENGDFITTERAKFCVESPGTSSFSKYSPSHPRNIQLSEEYLDDTKVTEPSEFLKKNLWWLTLLIGLCVITALFYYIKNH